jgi:hypothetical protein
MVQEKKRWPFVRNHFRSRHSPAREGATKFAPEPTYPITVELYRLPFAVPGHHPRPVIKRPVDDFAESGLGILKLPSVHCRPLTTAVLVRANQHCKAVWGRGTRCAVISEIASSLRSSQ